MPSQDFDPFGPAQPRTVSVKLPGIMAEHFDSYCLKMQLRRSDALKVALEEYLEKRGIPAAIYKYE